MSTIYFISNIPTCDRGLISQMYKELRKLDTNISNNIIKKWATELNREFSAEESQIAEKYLKKCSKSLVIREMQIKRTLRFHLIPIKMAKIKNSGEFLNKLIKKMLERMWRKRNTSPSLLG